MLFRTTDAHEKLRAEIRAFAESEVKPQAFLMDKENGFPAEAVKKPKNAAGIHVLSVGKAKFNRSPRIVPRGLFILFS